MARQDRDQDRRQAEAEQRETVDVSYINAISRFRDRNIGNVTRNPEQLIYIPSKILVALRTVDVERKKNILLFLKDSLCSPVPISMASSIVICLFENVIFREISFRASDFTRSTFINTQFIRYGMDEVNFHEAIISESKFDSITFSNVNLSAALVSSPDPMDSAEVKYPILTNGSLSRIECHSRTYCLRFCLLSDRYSGSV